ncbi:hypothetical protein AMATHDRAFT_46553 [Amanita thiersii Skay4041]|uniref:FAD-binding PCMH-type domain-containing protein n=1 Tax=Amanita thiersii Skay4041 TaxID=703135 RepID=A0A2A9NQ04_9AGAR|nr:hypothetical protein AMATHDRAFT_46553 [Amanita thiersii Skay4041]
MHDRNVEPLNQALYEELKAVCRGDVINRGDTSFVYYTTIFNGNVVSLSKAAVCPLDAEDISRVLLFCTEHHLSPSVKAGGYGTGGWAIGGDIVIDLCKLVEVDIEPPRPDGTFTSLRDVASANSKGKRATAQESSSANLIKPLCGMQRREVDIALRMYDFASLTTASFLRGTPSPRFEGDLPPGEDTQISTPHTLLSPDALSNYGLSPTGFSNTTGITTPSNNAPFSVITGGQSKADPFGYMDSGSADVPSDSFTGPPRSAYFSSSPTLQPLSQPFSFGEGPSDPLSDPTQFPLHSSVEPIYPHAFVTFGTGMRQKEIDTFTAENKLEALYTAGYGDGIPYHVPFAAHPTGSSIMLLGGFGFLGRLHGLSIDNLVEVEMVLADGRIVVVSENNHPDLWWALRGAGVTLGIATRFKARAYPVPVVFAGNLLYRFHKTTAPSLIKHFRDCVKGAPRELYANVILTAGPAGKDSLVVIQMCYIGPKEKGQEFLSAISSWDGDQCLLNEVNEKSFLHQQDSVAQVLRGKVGRQWFIRSALISSLPDDIINETVMQFADTPVGCTWLFELAGGAIADFEDTCFPRSQREAAFTIAALHQWEMDLDDDRCVDSAEEVGYISRFELYPGPQNLWSFWISDTLKRVHVGGAFPSFLGRHESPTRVKACFGDNWERLCEIKRQYDPSNMFRNTFWPLNAEGDFVDPSTHEPPTPPIGPVALPTVI